MVRGVGNARKARKRLWPMRPETLEGDLPEMGTSTESSSTQAGEVIVEARNLSKIYRDFWGRSKKVALKPLDLEIRRGEIFGLLGPNGSGKTTTMKLLLGLIFPTSGEAIVFGKDATDVSKNDRIGYLPEESYLYKFLDAEETLDFYGRLFDMPPEERKRRADALIEMVGLSRDKKTSIAGVFQGHDPANRGSTGLDQRSRTGATR